MTDWPVPFKYSRFWRYGSKTVSVFVGITSRLFAYYLNKTKIHNINQFLELTHSRPKGYLQFCVEKFKFNSVIFFNQLIK